MSDLFQLIFCTPFFFFNKYVPFFFSGNIEVLFNLIYIAEREMEKA